MGNLAQMAKHQGHEVLGVDDKVYPPMSIELKSSGINFSEGYVAKNYDSADLYVIGNTISRGNEIMENILKNEDKIISGPDWLYKNVLKNKKVIAVSGTHGKTSVTSMIAHVLIDNNENPSYLVAGIPKGLRADFKTGFKITSGNDKQNTSVKKSISKLLTTDDTTFSTN